MHLTALSVSSARIDNTGSAAMSRLPVNRLTWFKVRWGGIISIFIECSCRSCLNDVDSIPAKRCSAIRVSEDGEDVPINQVHTYTSGQKIELFRKAIDLFGQIGVCSLGQPSDPPDQQNLRFEFPSADASVSCR